MDGFRELLQLGGGTLDQPKRRGSDDIDEVLRGPKGQNIRNFFEAIRWAEGGEPDIIVGGRERFDIKGDHPNKVGLVTKAGPSTAAGNYQITGTNWYGTKNRKGLKARIGAKDFGPENQLRGALRLFADRDNGAGLTALLNDDYETALKIAGKDWASLPGSSLYGKKRSRDEFFKRLKGYNQNVNPKQPGGEFEQLLNAGADNPEPEDEFQALLRYGQEESDQKTPQVPNQNMAPTQTSVPTKDGQVTESDPLDDNTVRQPLKYAKTVVYPNDESRFTESDEARQNRFSGITDTSVPGARPQSKREYVIDEVSGEIANKLSNPKIGLKIDREDVALVLKRYGFRGDNPNAFEKGYEFKIDENDPQDRDFINSIYQAHDLKEAVALDLISNGAPISGTLYETLYQKYGITPEYIKEKSSGTDEYFKQAVAQGDANRQLFDNFVQEETKKLQPGQSPEIAVNNAMAQTGWLEKEKLQAANEKSQKDFDHLVEETSGSLFDSARFFNEYVKKPLAYGVNTASNYPVFENIPKWSKEQSLEIAKEIVAKYGTVENYYRRQEELRQKYERGSGNAMAGPFEFVKRFGIGALKIAPQLGKAMSFLSTPAVLIYGTNKLQSYISGSPVLQSEDNPFYKISDRAEKFLDELKNSDFDDVESISLVADTLGQLTTQIVAGTLTGGATVPTLLGATAGASQMLDDAVQKKAAPLNVIAAGTVGALAAAPEGLILGKWFSKLGGAEKTHFLDSLFGSLLKRYGIEFGEKEAVEMTKATMRSMLSTAGKNILAGSVFEGTQEVTENHINDLAAYILYDQTPERWKKATTLTKEDAQSFVGGVIGGAFGGSFETAVEVLNSTQRQKLYEDLPSLMAENKFYEKYYLELKDALEKEAKTAEDRATYAAAIERDAELRQAPIDNELLKTLGYRPQDIERLSADDITVIQDNNLARETFRELKRKQVEALTGGALKAIGPEKSEIEAQTFEPSISTKITGPKKPPTPPPAALSAPAAPAKPKTETVAQQPTRPTTDSAAVNTAFQALREFANDKLGKDPQDNPIHGGQLWPLDPEQLSTSLNNLREAFDNRDARGMQFHLGKVLEVMNLAYDPNDMSLSREVSDQVYHLGDELANQLTDQELLDHVSKVAASTKVRGLSSETSKTLGPLGGRVRYITSLGEFDPLTDEAIHRGLVDPKTLMPTQATQAAVQEPATSEPPREPVKANEQQAPETANALPPKSQEKTTKAEKAKEEPKPVISDYVSESDAHAELQKKMGFEHSGTHGHDAINRKVDSWTKEKDGVTTTKFTVSRMGKTVAAAGIRTDAEAILKNFDFTDESKNTLAGITSPLDIRQVSVGRGGKGEVELSAGSQKYSLAFKSTSLKGVKGAKEAVKETPKKEKAPPAEKTKDVPPLEPVSKSSSKKAKGLEVGATVSIKGPAYRGKTYVIESVHGKGRDAKYRVTHNGQKVPKTFTAENFKPEEPPTQEARISQTKKSIVGVLGAEELAKANQPAGPEIDSAEARHGFKKSVVDIRNLPVPEAPTFAEKFQNRIKQRDKSLEDLRRIGEEILAEMQAAPEEWVHKPTSLSIEPFLRMPDGERYDPNNIDHLTAPIAVVQAYELTKKPDLLKEGLEKEAELIFQKRLEDFQGLLDYLLNIGEYASSEAALVAAAASMWSVKYIDGEVRLENIGNNRHNISVVDSTMAPAIVDQLRKGLSLKEAFKKGALIGIKLSQKKNANSGKNGWQRYEKSDKMSDAAELNQGCAGTNWCTYTGGKTTAKSHLSAGDFYVFYKDGKPEVAIRTVNDRVAEIRGNTTHQAVPEEYTPVLEKFFKENPKVTGGEILDDYKKRMEMLKEVLHEEEVTKKALDLAVSAGYFFWNTFTGEFSRDSRAFTASGQMRINLSPEIKKRLNKLFSRITATDLYEMGYLFYGPHDADVVAKYADKITFVPDTITLKRNKLSTSPLEIKLPTAKTLRNLFIEPDIKGLTLNLPNLKTLRSVAIHSKNFKLVTPKISQIEHLSTPMSIIPGLPSDLKIKTLSVMNAHSDEDIKIFEKFIKGRRLDRLSFNTGIYGSYVPKSMVWEIPDDLNLTVRYFITGVSIKNNGGLKITDSLSGPSIGTIWDNVTTNLEDISSPGGILNLSKLTTITGNAHVENNGVLNLPSLEKIKRISAYGGSVDAPKAWAEIAAFAQRQPNVHAIITVRGANLVGGSGFRSGSRRLSADFIGDARGVFFGDARDVNITGEANIILKTATSLNSVTVESGTVLTAAKVVDINSIDFNGQESEINVPNVERISTVRVKTSARGSTLDISNEVAQKLRKPTRDNLDIPKYRPLNPKLLKSVSDIRKLHPVYSPTFADKFQTLIKAKDRTIGDMMRIGREILSDMLDNPEKWIKAPTGLTLESLLTLPGGERYDPENPDHLDAPDNIIKLYEIAQNHPKELSQALFDEQLAIFEQRINDFRQLVTYLDSNHVLYPPSIGALIAAAAAKWSIKYDQETDTIKLSEIGNNRHNVSVIGPVMAPALMEALNKGLPLKEAFREGAKVAMKRAMMQNKRKGFTGWEVFKKSDRIEDAIELSDAAAGTEWCTFTGGSSTAHTQLRLGDFHIYYKDGRPEVAVRFVDKRVEETRGNTPAQALTEEQADVLAKYFHENASEWEGAEDILRDSEMRKAIKSIIKNDAILPEHFNFISGIVLFVNDKISYSQDRLRRPLSVVGYRGNRQFPPSIMAKLQKVFDKYTTLVDFLKIGFVPAGVYARGHGKLVESFAPIITHIGDTSGSKESRVVLLADSKENIVFPKVTSIGVLTFSHLGFNFEFPNATQIKGLFNQVTPLTERKNWVKLPKITEIDEIFGDLETEFLLPNLKSIGKVTINQNGMATSSYEIVAAKRTDPMDLVNSGIQIKHLSIELSRLQEEFVLPKNANILKLKIGPGTSVRNLAENGPKIIALDWGAAYTDVASKVIDTLIVDTENTVELRSTEHIGSIEYNLYGNTNLVNDDERFMVRIIAPNVKSIDTATLNGARLHTPDAVINTLVVNNIAEIKSNITAAEAKSVAVYTPSGDWIYNELDIRKMDALKIGYGAAASTTASHISVVSLRNKTRFKAPNLTSVDKITFGNMGRYELPLLESGEYEFVPTDDGIPDSIQRTIFDPTPPIMELSKENSKILKNIIGKVGVTQKSTIRELSDQLNSLDAAKEDIAKGVNPLQVWRETGWIYDSVAKEFKQHISTKDAYFTTRGLQEVISKEDSIAFNNSQLNYTDTPEGKKEFEKVKKAYEEWKKNPNDPKTTREKNRTRVEFDDNSKLYYKKVHGLPLDEILDFPELFQAYPEMRGIRVKFYNRLYGRKAYYSGASPITMTMSDGSIRTANYPGVIALSRHRDQQEMFSSLLHEVQHAIQHRERFPTGTSTAIIEGDYVTLETRFNQRNQFHLLTKGHINKLLTIPIKEFQNKSSYAISKMVDMYGYPQLTYMIEHVQDALKRFPRKDPVQLSRLILKEFDRQNEEAIKLLESEFEKGLKQVNDAYGIATPAKPLRTFNAEQLATQAYFASHGEIEARLVQQLDRLEEHTDISEKTIAEKIINDLNRPDSWTQIDRGMFGYHNLQQVYHSKQIEISSHPHGQGTPVTKPILFNKALDHRMLHLANQDGITEDHIKGLNSKIIEGNIYVSPEMMDITRRIAGSFDPTMQTVITGFSAESEDIGKLIAAFKDIKKQMREAGYEPIQLKAIDKIIKQLNDLGTDKPIVIYTDGDILPHEMTHKLRSIHAELGPLASYYSNFDEVYKKTEPLAKKAYSAFYRENYFEGKAYSKLTTADKLLLQEEMIATIVNGNYEDLGLTDREAAEFLFNDLSNYVQTHGTDIVDSLERWINEKLRLSGVLSAVKNNYGSLPEESESGERATSAGEPEKQKTESKHEPKSKTAQRQTPETIAKHTNLQFEDLGTHADEYIVKNRIAQSNEAEKWLNEVGIGVAYEEALGLTEASALNTAKRMAVIEYIDDKVDFFTENNNIARAKAWYDLLVRFTNAISPQFTEYGQAISQLAKWNNYDPERIITTLQKGLRNSKTPRDLTFDEQNAIRQWSEDIAQLHFEEKQLIKARDEFDNETVRRMIIAARRMATGAVAHLKGIFPSAAEEADIILNPDENIKKSVVGNPIEEKPLTELDAVTQKALTDLGLLVHLQGEFPYKYQDWQSAFANELSNLGIANFPVEVYQRAIYRNVLAQEISLKHMIRLEQIMDKFGFTEVGQAYEKLAEMKAKRIANRIILSDNKKYANENPDKRTVMEIAIDNELTSSGSLISREDVLLAFDRNKFFGEMAKKGLSFTATMNQYLDALDIIHKAQIELKKERRLIRAQKQLANKGVIGGFTEAEIDENDAKLNEIRVTKARKTRELNRFIAEIKKQPASRSQRAADWYKRINRSGEALLTATLKTAAHNVIAQRTTKAFYAIEMALSVLFQKTPLLNQIFEEDPMMYDQDVKFWQPLIEDLSGSFSFSNARAAIDEMRNGDANLVEALKLLMLHKERVAQGFLAHNPDLYDKMIGQFTYGDVKEHVHPISKDWNRATRGMEKFVRGMEHYVNWATVLNRIQEKHFRFSTFIANVNLQLKAKGIDPFTVNAEDIPRHMLEIAVKRALEDTFGEDFNLDSVVGQAVDRTSEAMSWIPFPINPLLFRRFFFNSLKFVYDHSAMMPVKLVTTGKISARDMAKFSTGLLMFLVSLQMLRQFGADDDDPTLLKFFGRHYRMSAYNPLANFLVLANVVNRSLKGKSPLKDSANLLDLIGIDSRYPNQGLTFLKDFFNAFGTSPTKLEAFSKTAKITGGKALAAFARPLATLRDLATLFDGDQAVLRDYHEAPFSGELMKITPWGDNLGEEFFGLNIPKRRDEVKDDYIRKDAPILDQLGITYVSDSLVGPKMTPAEEYLDTETANNRFVIKYRTVEEKRTAAIMSQFYQAIDKGVDIRPRLKAMQTERKLDQEHVKKLMDSFRIKNTLIRKSKGASILQLITAMDYGDEQEKGVLKKVIKRKILAARSPFDEFEKARIRQVFPNFR